VIELIIINKGNIVADDKLSNLQKSDNELSMVMVTFKESVDAEILNNLFNVQEVEAIQKLPGEAADS
jgi:ABC-2 type transport system ATP-binding protein